MPLTKIIRFSLAHLIFVSLLFNPGLAGAGTQQEDPLNFDDTMLPEELEYPDWFKLSFGDLREDITEAREAGKFGIIVYYGQKRCAYCEQFIEQDLGATDIATYLQKYFDIIPIDIWGIQEITDADGKVYTERELSLRYKTNFTPSLIFYDIEGKPVFKLRGFHPPYSFRAALKYVVEGFYYKESFRDYLARAEPGKFFLTEGMNERDFFEPPPYNLKKHLQNGKPMAVFFEHGECHTCDLLHGTPLNDKDTLEEIQKMTAIQLNMWSDIPVTTPAGKKTTARQWADELQLFYAPSLIFFDSNGNEIIRIDSVVQFYRLWGVLNYVSERGYLTEPNYQLWRLKQRKLK